MELQHTVPTQKRVDAYVVQAKHLRSQTLVEFAKRYLHLPKHGVSKVSVRSH